MDIAAEYLELFLAFSAVVGVLYGLIRRGQKALEQKISAQIGEATRQIQPGANGGLSLSDVARGVQELRSNQQAIAQRLNDMDDKFSARFDASDAVRSVILSQVEADRASWVSMLSDQGIRVPTEAVRYMKGEK